MWKCLSRGFKGTLDRNVYRCNTVQTTKVTQDSTKTFNLLKLSPVLVKHFNRFYTGYYRTCCCGQHKKDRERRDRAKHTGCLDDIKEDFFEALRWSSVFILGWYLCLPWRHRHTFSRYSKEIETLKNVEQNNDYSTKLLRLISNYVISKPINYVLPEVSASKSSPLHTTEEEEKSEELRKACLNLEETHQSVQGALSNWLGTECMQKGKHAQAVVHFHEAAAAENAAGVFNLGICHEMGLGAPQDFTLAGALYKRASNMGHATAMYNLAIFHVHGWGGLPVDTNRARELFKSAAALGQKDAKRALQLDFLEPETPPPSPCPPKPRNNDATEDWFRMLNISLDGVESEKAKKNDKPRFSSGDSGVLDLSQEMELKLSL